MFTTIRIEIDSDNTVYSDPSDWRKLGAKHKFYNIQTLLNNQGLRPATILEVGAGDGAIMRWLSEAEIGDSLNAVEVSSSGVDVIQRSNIARLDSCQIFDGYHLPYEDNSFDLIILSHVLEHVEYERALLREIKRVSRYQIIEIPMDWMGLSNSSNFLMWQSYGHINAHSPSSLRFLLSTEGFQLVDDLLLPFPEELAEFDFFENNSRVRTRSNLIRYKQRQFRNLLSNKIRRTTLEQRASSYTVLTQSMSEDETRLQALETAKTFVDQGRPNIALLIANKFLRSSGPEFSISTISSQLLQLEEHIKQKTRFTK